MRMVVQRGGFVTAALAGCGPRQGAWGHKAAAQETPPSVTWQTFWTEDTDQEDAYLRRYAEGLECPLGGSHDVMWFAARIPAERDEDGYSHERPVDYFARSQYPTECPCGYTFTEDDPWQVWTDSVYRRPDTGEEWGMRSLPPGAMFDAFWSGTDGIALTVVLPYVCGDRAAYDARASMWNVDGPATSKDGGVKWGAWTRTGDPKAVPPTVTASPSIDAGSPCYHGFLTNGVLTDPI